MLGAKVFFLVVGFVQQPLLRLAVGLSDFGGLAQALVVANIVNNVVVASGTQGVSRAVVAAPGHEARAWRAAMRVHVPAAIVVAAAMAAAAPVYASFEHAADVVAPLVVLALVALLYGIYAPIIGYLNGTKRFGRQAALDVVFGTLRTLGLVGFGYAFVARGLSGVLGTTVGWVAAAACIVPLAARSAGLGAAIAPDDGATRAGGAARPDGVPRPGAYVGMLLPIAGAQLCTNVLIQVDIFLLGRFLSQGAASAGLADGAQRDAVKVWLATYKECQTFAFLPYQLLFSVTLILFPMVARAHAAGDTASVRAYVARGARLSAIFGGLLVAVVAALPESMLAFAYGKADAARGADVLRVMALGQGAFAMLAIATTVLTSLGRERTAALLTLGAVVAVTGACAALVPSAQLGTTLILRSAQATAGALGGGARRSCSWWCGTGWRCSAFVPAATGVRVGTALAACVALGFLVPCVGRFVTPAVAMLVGLGFAVLLLAMREVGKADLAMLRSLRGSKK